RSVARSMSTLPGRKSLVWLTSGMAMTPDIQAEMTALISVCNRSNVAVYPLDVRGLTDPIQGRQSVPFLRGDDSEFSYAPVDARDDETPRLVYVAQTKGGGGGGKTGGGTTGNTGGRTG